MMHCDGDGIEAASVVSLARLSSLNGSVLCRWVVGIAALTPPYAPGHYIGVRSPIFRFVRGGPGPALRQQSSVGPAQARLTSYSLDRLRLRSTASFVAGQDPPYNSDDS
jgi:hypothetical protein